MAGLNAKEEDVQSLFFCHKRKRETSQYEENVGRGAGV